MPSYTDSAPGYTEKIPYKLSYAAMHYATGQTVEVGDEVLIEHGQTPGRVSSVIETSEHMAEWNLNEPGLMLESKPFGLVFWPSASEDPVVFVSRSEASAP